MNFAKEIQAMVYWHLFNHGWKYAMGLTAVVVLVVAGVAVVL